MMPKNCNRCGLCCRNSVKVSDEDIGRIKRSGHEKARLEKDYLVVEADNTKHLKLKADGYCVFYAHGRRPDGKALGVCTLYDDRPEMCRDFPGKAECTIYKETVYEFFHKKDMPGDIELPKPLAELTNKDLDSLKRI